MNLLRTILFCLFIGFLWKVNAGSDLPNYCWKFAPPDTRADESALHSYEIDHYRVYLDGVGNFNAMPEPHGFCFPDLALGIFCLSMETIDTDGRRSVRSKKVCKVI